MNHYDEELLKAKDSVFWAGSTTRHIRQRILIDIHKPHPSLYLCSTEAKCDFSAQ